MAVAPNSYFFIKTMTRKDFIHQAMLAMASNCKCFAPNMHTLQSSIDELKNNVRRLADAAQEVAPFDE